MTEEYSIPPETIMSPRAREIARENNLHLSDLPKKGSGKDGGFTVPDVNKAVKKAVKKAKKAEKIAKIARNNDNQKEYERRFAEHHDGTYLDDQEIGSAVDFIDKNEKKVEIKFDFQSLRYGRLYLELHGNSAQRDDDGNHLGPGPQQDAGYRLARKQADVFMVVNDHVIWEFSIEDMDKLVKENILGRKDGKNPPIIVKQTRPGASGNARGIMSGAIAIPFDLLDQYCSSKKRNDLPRGFPWWVPNQGALSGSEKWDLVDLGSIPIDCACCGDSSKPCDS